MSTASTAFSKMLGICEDVFWDTITYKTSSINAKIDVDSVVENQDGVFIADATFVLKKADFTTTPPTTGDPVTIPSGVIGAGSYRVGDIIANDELTYTIVGHKVG